MGSRRTAAFLFFATAAILANGTAAADPPAAAAARLSTAPPAPPSAARTAEAPALAGWHGGFFLRDPDDQFRLYPRGRLHLDFHSFPGAATSGAKDGGTGLQPRFFARRLRLELSGQLFRRFTFTLGVDFGGQALSNAKGKVQESAAPAGEAPTATSASFAPVEEAGGAAVIANAFINYSFGAGLNLMFGQHQGPLGMENRTSNLAHSFPERNVAIRGFVFPSSKEIGLFVWGDLLDARLTYEVGVFAGDGPNRPQVDAHPDFIGRVFTRPLLSRCGALQKLQIGVSGRVGHRDPTLVGYDYPAISTGQGFALWQPRHKDPNGRGVHVIPADQQLTAGGELRVPVSMFDLRAEAYYVSNDTREAADGFQLTGTERRGRVRGAGAYMQISAWPFGDRFVSGDPGFSRPFALDLSAPAPRIQQGLEVAGLMSVVNATYEPGSRDAPASGGKAGSAILVFQYGVALSYYYSRNARAMLAYSAYHAPGSGSAANLVKVPDSNASRGDPGQHVLHELGTRLGFGF